MAQALQLPRAASAASQVGAASRTREQEAPQAVETAAQGLGKVVAEAPSAWAPPELARAAWREPGEVRHRVLEFPAQGDRRPAVTLLKAPRQELLAAIQPRLRPEAQTYACTRPARIAAEGPPAFALPGMALQWEAVAPGAAEKA